MSLLSIVLLAIALSIDAGVVSFAHGLIFEKNKLKNALLLGSYTGGFQALMPLLGYFLTKPFQAYFEPIGKWIVFVIYTIIIFIHICNNLKFCIHIIFHCNMMI